MKPLLDLAPEILRLAPEVIEVAERLAAELRTVAETIKRHKVDLSELVEAVEAGDTVAEAVAGLLATQAITAVIPTSGTPRQQRRAALALVRAIRRRIKEASRV